LGEHNGALVSRRLPSAVVRRVKNVLVKARRDHENVAEVVDTAVLVDWPDVVQFVDRVPTTGLPPYDMRRPALSHGNLVALTKGLRVLAPTHSLPKLGTEVVKVVEAPTSQLLGNRLGHPPSIAMRATQP